MNPHKNPDSSYIQNMFDRLAGRYDLFNHLTSLGMAGRWRKAALEPVKKGMRVLDLGCGTGDLAILAAAKTGPAGEVTGLDFSSRMLALARKRYEYSRLNGKGGRLHFIQAKAEDLPIGTAPYDLVVSGFVLRNLYENIGRILKGVFESLRPGGEISFLDFTEPDHKAFLFLWRVYLNTVAVFFGKMLFGRDYPAFYLTESARRFLKADELTSKLEAAGFRDIHARSFLLGAIRLYRAVKPPPVIPSLPAGRQAKRGIPREKRL
ncbi:MAG: ubiquinone/menaquinone biosynthesis methyltransferase [Candidatus Omnitrophica bacterium]|nr:ubiquinone/menaquinone biosynthesis methyltransferase [Candidatus Omnitrophota bacterium]